ncbi:unnamed protein product, partial [Linum tenue]
FLVEGLPGDAKVKGVNLGGWLVVEGWIKPSLFDGIPNGDMLDGTEVQFKSVTLQRYISAENGGGMGVSVGKDSPSAWETFRVRFSNKLLSSLCIDILLTMSLLHICFKSS